MGKFGKFYINALFSRDFYIFFFLFPLFEYDFYTGTLVPIENFARAYRVQFRFIIVGLSWKLDVFFVFFFLE